MKWLEYIFNVLFWLVTGWLITSSFSIQGQEIEIFNDVETIRTVRNQSIVQQLLWVIGISAAAFYSNLYNISLLKKQANRGGVLVVALLLLVGAITSLHLVEQNCFDGQLILPKQMSIGILLFYFTISSAYAFIKIWIQAEQKQKSYALAAKQAELHLLRNQLHPHFLFNALNNLLSLVNQQKSPKLASSFEGLSQLLRYVIEETKAGKVAIAKEITFIKNYCDLQLLRFEDNEVNLEFNVLGIHTHQLVEPGLFIPFVENAFKYGAIPETVSTISVTFDVSRDKKIAFHIQNKSYPELQQRSGAGTGIKMVEERLGLVYPEKHELNIEENDHFIVKLKISTN